MSTLESDLLQDYGVTIAVSSEKQGHSLSVWGYEYDEWGNYTGLWVTDSDDDMNGLKRLSVFYDPEDNLWHIDWGTDYIYEDSFILGLISLVAFSYKKMKKG